MPVAAIVIVVLALSYAVFRAMKTHFICPKCGTSFKVNALQYVFAVHSFGKRVVKCQNCGHTDLMTPEWDKKE